MNNFNNYRLESLQAEFPDVKVLDVGAVVKLPKDQRFTVLYLRVSTDEQSKTGFSMQDQGPIALKWAEGKEWHKYPVMVITDDGESASHGWQETDKKHEPQRNGFTKLHDLIRERRVANILVAYSDRLSRNDYFTQALTHDCRFYDTRIHCHDLGEDMQLEEKALLLTVNGAVASQTARVTKRKVKDSLKRRADQGLPSGKAPYGWKNHRLTEAEEAQHMRPWVEPDENTKEWVLRMRGWFLSGLSIGQIATKLTAFGVPTAKGKMEWKKEVVWLILSNPIHCGMFRYHGKSLEGQHKTHAYWTEEEHEEMLRIYTRRNTCRHSFEHSDRHLLGGLIHCGTCGKPLRYGLDDRQKGGPRYYCENGCPGVRARVDLVDKYVLRSLRELAALPATMAMVEDEAEAVLKGEMGDDSETIKRLESQKKIIEQALVRAYDGWCRGLATEEVYVAEKQRLDAELKLVSDELAEHAGRRHRRDELVHRLKEVVEIVRGFDGMWGCLDRNERREVLHLISERLILENRDSTAVLKVKLFFLEEREFAIPTYKHIGAWKMGKFEGLLITWLACAKMRIDGMSDREIAESRGLDLRTVRTYWSGLKKAMGLTDLQKALEKLRPDLEQMDPELLMRDKHGNGKGNDRPLSDNERGALLARLETGDFAMAARKLGVTRSCFNSRLNGAYRKLGVRTFEDAVKVARTRGIIGNEVVLA